MFSTSVAVLNLKYLAGSSCKDFLRAGNFCSSSIILARFICLADILKQMYKQISWATLVTSIKKIYSVLSRNVIKNRRECNQVAGELLCEHTWKVMSSTELVSTKGTRFLNFFAVDFGLINLMKHKSSTLSKNQRWLPLFPALVWFYLEAESHFLSWELSLLCPSCRTAGIEPRGCSCSAVEGGLTGMNPPTLLAGLSQTWVSWDPTWILPAQPHLPLCHQTLPRTGGRSL